MDKNKPDFKLCWDLYKTFFSIGLFTFGGGYAMLPLLTRKIVDNKHWVSEEEILNYFAIAQCTPGIIAVNTSTFVGYKLSGILGGIIATLGFISPSIIIILLIANVLNFIVAEPLLQSAFAGIRIAVTALIFSTVIKLFKSNVNSYIKAFIALFSFVSVAFFHVSPIIVTIIASTLGILVLGGAKTNA